MNVGDHLQLAGEYHALARQLAQGGAETSWRWSAVVAFYSAYHQVHALFAARANELPPDVRRRRISFVHPAWHGMDHGGTRHSLALLTSGVTRIETVNDVFDDMRIESNTARYGRNGVRLVTFTRDDAFLALARFEELKSLVSAHMP